jgi:hypothetical protein
VTCVIAKVTCPSTHAAPWVSIFFERQADG